MNTFFYSATSSNCGKTCHYETCSKRCLSQLVNLPFFQNMKVLPGGSRLNTPTSMELRSGDIIILYAENREDIDKLLSIKDFFDTFRVVLILGKENLVQYSKYYNLNPRYTTPIGKGMDKLSAVVDKMIARPNFQATYDQQQEQSYA
jgi:hypothetical protein